MLWGNSNHQSLNHFDQHLLSYFGGIGIHYLDIFYQNMLIGRFQGNLMV